MATNHPGRSLNSEESTIHEINFGGPQQRHYPSPAWPRHIAISGRMKRREGKLKIASQLQSAADSPW